MSRDNLTRVFAVPEFSEAQTAITPACLMCGGGVEIICVQCHLFFIQRFGRSPSEAEKAEFISKRTPYGGEARRHRRSTL